jgi:hypothetical protein
MSRDDLRDLFADLAEDVAGARLADSAVAGARRVRRRRRIVASAALAVAATTVAAVAFWSPEAAPPAGTVVPPSMTGQPDASIRIDRLPDTIPGDRDSGSYWPRSLTPPTDAPVLATTPLSHAVLLAMPLQTGIGAPLRVYAYGEGSVNGGSGDGRFRWVRLDVNLLKTLDEAGTAGWPVDHNSLAPMGRRAAFPQRDGVLLVDLTDGGVDVIPVPGFNEDVTWLPNGKHVLVSSRTETWLVNVETRTVVKAKAQGGAVTPLVGGASGLTTLTDSRTNGPTMLQVYDDGGLVERGSRPVDGHAAGPYQFGFLIGRGWRYGNLIAQAAASRPDSDVGDFVAVVDDRTDGVTHVLDIGARRDRGCCTAVGWSGGDDVLVNDTEGLLRWHLPTGAVTRLSAPVRGIVSVAPTGCDWSITIDQVTSACTR